MRIRLVRRMRTSPQCAASPGILGYDWGVISQGKGAELAGLSRAEFIDELGWANVSAIQTSVDELREEMKQVRDADR